MFKTESKILKWMGNKYINEIVTKDLNKFLQELEEAQNSISVKQTKSFATIDKVKLESNEEEHYLILRGNKDHKSKLKEVVEIIVAHLENEFKIHTKFNLNEVRYGGRGAAGWELHREFSLLLKVI
tara:strand:- start:4367 stop:4744 length:378 start_codon:yes stop_codon:yes gene_type:complete